MPSSKPDHDDEDDGDNLADHELPDESDMDSFDEPGIMPCPHCRKMVSEEAELCPHCKNYISVEDAPSRNPGWITVGVIIAIAIVVIVGILR
jgi:RNA polymerase subunit RPABC4/transcription elongation factor Spt4